MVMRDVVVIGAGVSGLRVNQLLRDRNVRDIVVLEARPHAGGRVRSVYDRGTLQYEAGPWRIPESHARARRLFEAHGVPLRFTKTPLPQEYGDRKRVATGLSEWDANTLAAEDALTADRLDQQSGYAGSTFGASGAGDVLKTTEHFFVAPDGFTELCRRMAEDADVWYNTRVVDVVPTVAGYEIVCSVRGKDDVFRELRVQCRVIFVCIPPHAAQRWSVASRLNAHLHRVEAACLHHIYAHGPHPSKTHRVDTSTPLVQTVSDQYEQGWFQASYTGGRAARFWHHLRLAHPERFVELLRAALARVWPTARMDAPPRSHFWEHAYHRWRPVPGFNLRLAVSQSVYPNPVSCENLFWAGEAFSSHQAWIEGALETAEIAVEACFHRFVTHAVRACAPSEIVVEDRILDVTRWARVHPGSEGAIRNHLGEDVTRIFEHVGHSDHAWAIVAALQVGWCRRAPDIEGVVIRPARTCTTISEF